MIFKKIITIGFTTATFSMLFSNFSAQAKNKKNYETKHSNIKIYKFNKKSKNIKLNKTKVAKKIYKFNLTKSLKFKGHKFAYIKEANGYVKYSEITKSESKNQRMNPALKQFFKNMKKSNTKSNTANGSTTTSKAKIVDGFDETNNKIVDWNSYFNAYKQELLNYINNERQLNNISALSENTTLDKLADIRANDSLVTNDDQQALAQESENGSKLSHLTKDGTPKISILAVNAGLFTNTNDATAHLGETFANWGVPALESPKEAARNVFDNYKYEPGKGHYNILTNPKYTQIGISLIFNSKTELNPDNANVEVLM